MSIWVLTDDRIGTNNQALGVAEALIGGGGLEFSILKLEYNNWVRLPNLLRGATLLGVANPEVIAPPWPSLVIAAGRRTAPIARYIKAKSGAKLVQLMDPGLGGRGDFDLIAIPNHDNRKNLRPNEMGFTGAAHRVTPLKLEVAGKAWQERLGHLPRPWNVLIVGGSTRKREFTEAMAEELAAEVRKFPGSFLVTTSRRTGEKPEAALIKALEGRDSYIYDWRKGGDNPYFAFLALGDLIMVTGDSVSMCVEACASSKSVLIYGPEALITPKHARLHQELFALGLAAKLGDEIPEGGLAFNPGLEIATRIRAILN